MTYDTTVSPKGGHLLVLKVKRLRGYLQNISGGGICFKTKYQLQRKMVLKVNMPLTDTGIAPTAPTLAQVSWVRKDSKHKEYRTGLKFII